ncbi:MAG: PepSY protein [Xanthobacteraceae bacterium]|nr:PepSY protein [Xanthobacteraceae bacterium]
MKAWLLKFHRWTALLFALPLVVLLATGLILSFEPWLVDRAIEPGTLSPARIEALVKQHDPGGRVRTLGYRSYDKALTISAGRGGGTVVDVGSGQALSGPSALANTLVTVRRLHETLLINAGWIVIGATGAMLMLIVLGVLMGLPLVANTLSGWHKAIAWFLLPLIVLSPLTGMFMATGITFASRPPAAAAGQGAPMALTEAVQVLGKDHDLSALVWLRPQGGRMLARVVEGGEYVVYAVTREGATVMPRNWPRLWHEGNFAGVWSALMNVVASLAMITLLVTGVWIWTRRQIRRRARHLSKAELA